MCVCGEGVGWGSLSVGNTSLLISASEWNSHSVPDRIDLGLFFSPYIKKEGKKVNVRL